MIGKGLEATLARLVVGSSAHHHSLLLLLLALLAAQNLAPAASRRRRRPSRSVARRDAPGRIAGRRRNNRGGVKEFHFHP